MTNLTDITDVYLARLADERRRRAAEPVMTTAQVRHLVAKATRAQGHKRYLVAICRPVAVTTETGIYVAFTQAITFTDNHKTALRAKANADLGPGVVAELVDLFDVC